LFDGLTWDALQIAERTAASDKWQSMAVIGNEVWLFGSESTEIWRNYGTQSPAYPVVFAPVPGAFIESGIGATFSVCNVNSSPVWVSRTAHGHGQIVVGNGYGQPTVISTPAVEYAIQNYATVSDAIAFTYSALGHTFYVVSFPGSDATWVYDATEQMWHERLFWDEEAGEWLTYRPRFHAFVFGVHLVQHGVSGDIYEMSSEFFGDVGDEPLRRLRQVPFPSRSDDWMFLSRFQLDVQPGIGRTGQGANPQVMFQVSRDFGKTWGTEMWRSAGASGAYNTRVLWNRLGRFRGNRGVARIVMTDPGAWRLIGAHFDAEMGVA
jgi:hypothetical protein